jgi:hypothetical protein
MRSKHWSVGEFLLEMLQPELMILWLMGVLFWLLITTPYALVAAAFDQSPYG